MLRKKLMAILLSGSMLLVSMTAGCGNPPAGGSGSSVNPPQSAGTGSTADPLGKYDPPIEIHAAIYSVGSSKYPEGDSLESNIFTRAYENDLGIKLTYDWTADYGGYGNDSAYNQKMNIAIASGQIPEMFFVNNTQLKQLIESEQLADLTPLLEQYGTEELKTNLNGDGGTALESGSYQGSIYGIPLMSAGLFWGDVLWVRTDWLNNLGMPIPEQMTVEDFHKISEAFTKQDPDQNGKNDTFGFGLQKTFAGGMGNLPGFLNMYGAYDLYLQDEKGTIYNGGTQPEMKIPLQKLQDMYKDGQIDPEFGTKDLNMMAEDIVNGKIGLMFGAWWDPYWPFLDCKTKDPKAEWKPYPVPSVDGGLAEIHSWFPVQGYFVASKACEHPEALIKMFNFYQSRWTPEYYDPSYFEFEDADGTTVAMAHHAFVRTDTSDHEMITSFNIQAEAMTTGDLSKILLPADKTNVELAIKYRDSKDMAGYSQYLTINPDDGVWKIFQTYWDQKMSKPVLFFGSPTKTMEEKGTILSDLNTEITTKIIMGEPVEAFDAYVKQWKEQGGEQILKEVNEWAQERASQ